jgi:integrase
LLADSYYDVAISNIPFGDYKPFDSRFKKWSFVIHDYFFAKALDKVRPGGLILFVTSKGTLDKLDGALREYVANQADLLGVIRLPNDAFKKKANTEVTTDIVMLRKRLPSELPNGPAWKTVAEITNSQGESIPVNEYFAARPEMMLGEMRLEERRMITLQQLNERQIDAFFKARRTRVSRRSREHATMTLLLRHLRQSQAISGPPPPSDSEIDSLRLQYENFLLQQRALGPANVQQYAIVVRRFLGHHFKRGKLRLKKLRAKHIADFVLHDSASRGRRSAQFMATVLRSFLAFLFQHGRIPTNLSAAVPTVAGWRLSELPRFLEAEQVEKIVRSCDRRRNIGKRDYAILLLIARLGLRAGEVANLSLDDINWRAAELQIRGKRARVDRLPLLDDVGKALADYLQKGRPECATRRVFIQSKAPYVGFPSPPNGISGIVRAAIKRAKIIRNACIWVSLCGIEASDCIMTQFIVGSY